jgi:sugar phosphate isomerase/epimerase
MRLGGPVFERADDPEQWVAALRRLGYGAAYCPVDESQGDEVVQAYAGAAKAADIVIAEVGAWSNPLSPDEPTRRAALALCQTRLALADEIGARCCVNIAGSRGELWDGPHPDNLTPATFDLIVETVRQIVDAVKPRRTFYTLEPMPWVYPDSADSYLRLLRTIDRPQVAAHLDPVNIVSSPQRFYANGALIRECFAKLSPYIKSCHAKDIRLDTKLTVHLDEVRPGLGGLDYRAYLQELDRLDPDTPLMLEHLSTAEEYELSASYVRSVAEELQIALT